MVIFMAGLYLTGAASCYGYNQLMVRVTQKVVSEIRFDLFTHAQRLPLNYFDTHTHGELMSRFTNDVDTITEALNGSFTMLIQSFITITGTLIMLVVLDWRLSMIVFVFLGFMMAFIRFNGRRSRKYFTRQQKYLGSINGFVEEMVAGQKVEKVFNHEPQDFEEFCRPQRGVPQGFHQGPDLLRHDHPHHRVPLLCKLRGFRLRGRPLRHGRADGPGHRGLLPGVRAAERDAHEPVHPADQLPAGGSLRRRAHFRDDE